MAIEGLDQDEFRRILRTNLTSARAISDPSHLRGRAAKLQQIDRAFNSPGKHVFVYGDRGVGKTSLALSAAILHQTVAGGPTEPIIVSCDRSSTAFQLVRDIAKSCLPPEDQARKRTSQESISASIGGFGWNTIKSNETTQIPNIESVNDSINMLKFAKQFHSTEPIIVIDEFDRLNSDVEKSIFADIIKQISDRDIGIRLIMTGIGKSLDDLIGVHFSTGRYISPIELDRLNHDARWEIITHAANELGILIDKEFTIRIGQISDGFPYYIHLAGEMIFWAMFYDYNKLYCVNYDVFERGLKDASNEAEATLRQVYDKATQKYTDHYEEVLWAVADMPHLRRQIREIYQNSYLRVAEDHNPTRPPLELQGFYNRMHNLKTERHGEIIETTSAGWYQFRENVVRGYVRLRAEHAGVQLDRDTLKSMG